jgi:DNA primase
MRGTVDTIKERLDIADVVGSYLKLEKSGQNFKGKCPFHNEKTASFFVSTARQTYYCFGCGAKGDMFTLVEELEGVDFRGALKLLADKAGVEIEEYRGSGETKTEKDKLYTALEDATLFFENELEKNKSALEYLRSRGISDESIKDWRLGFAPAEWRALHDHLKSVGHSEEILLKAGLIKKPDDQAKQPYDVFRGRIIFPLSDASGKIIAFSGRALLPDDMPKYLNTPETALFAKSEVLYGLSKAKEEIRKKNFAILVEGQMDLVMSHQSGVRNTVASSGTAFTIHHLERLKRLSSRIILAFDGDEAGEKAAEKSAILGLSLGMEVKIAKMPEGRDPADLARESTEEWKKVLRDAKHSIEHILDLILLREKDNRKAGRAIGKSVLPLLTLLGSSIERSHFISLIAKKSGLREEILWEDLRRTSPPKGSVEAGDEVESKDEALNTAVKRPRKSHIERRLAGTIFWQKSLPQPSIDITSLEGEMIKRVGEGYFRGLMENLEMEREALIFEAESYFGNSGSLSQNIAELLDNLTDDLLHEELPSLIVELSRAEGDKNEELISDLGSKILDIHKRMRELEERRKML